MTTTTPNGIRAGHRVTVIAPALPDERGELLVTEVIWPNRLVLRNAAGQMICRDPNYWEVERVILPLPLSAQAGRHVVNLSQTRPGVYYLEVLNGSGAVDTDLTKSYGDEATARDRADMVTRTLRDLAKAKTAVSA